MLYLAGEQRTGRDLAVDNTTAATAAAVAPPPALNTEVLLEKEDAAVVAKEVDSDDANEVANAVKVNT